MEQVKKLETGKEDQKKPAITPATEERLRIIANLIIDRIIEDQQSGSLKFKNLPAK